MSRMSRILRGLTVGSLAAVSLLLGASQCAKQRDRTKDFVVEKQADLSRLAVVAAARSYLLGIDTTTFRVEARIRCSEIQFDKLARLPDGGVLVVDEAYGRRHRIYRLDPDCSLRASAPVPGDPPTPFVHGNLVLMGAGYFSSGDVPVQVYRLDDLAHLTTFSVEGSLIRQEFFCAQGDRIFLPYVRAIENSNQGTAYPVMLDAKNLKLTHLHEGTPREWTKADEFVSVASGDSLIMIPVMSCHPVIFDVATRRTLAQRDLSEEMKARVGRSHGTVSQPVVHNGMLYAIYAWSNPRAVCWMKIRLSDLTLIDAKRVLQDDGAWYAGDDFHTFGRYYVIETNQPIGKIFTATFIDWRTGEIAGQCTVNDLSFKHLK